MSGMNISGKIMVQESQAGGFEAHVYPSRVDAAMQLLRVEIRMAADTEGAILNIEAQVSELINEERAELEG